MFSDVVEALHQTQDDPYGITRYVIVSATTNDPAALLSDPEVRLLGAVMGEEPEVPAGMRIVDTAQQLVDVLSTWSEWRGDRMPSVSEAAQAIFWYQEHDAYMPVS